MHRCLVVANQTLGGNALLTKLKSLADAGPLSIYVLVPATHPRDQWTWTEGEAIAIAKARLEAALERFRALRAEVDGGVGTERPMDAIRDTLRERRFDEIILSTLPPGLSRWLKQDLPSRVARTFNLPVTNVIGEMERVAG